MLDALSEGNIRRPGPKCSVGLALAAMDPERSEKIRHLIDDTTRSAAQIAEVMVLMGFDMTHYRVTHHRKRKRQAGCRCPR